VGMPVYETDARLDAGPQDRRDQAGT